MGTDAGLTADEQSDELDLVILWRFKSISRASLRVHSHLSRHRFGGLWLNHKFGSRFSVLACFCGDRLNTV